MVNFQCAATCAERFDAEVGKVAGFSLHAGVTARADQRQKLERLCRYISRPPISENRLALTPNGNVRYQLRRPDRDGTMHAIFEPLELMALIPVRHPAGGLRSSKSAILPICHCPAGRPGAEAASQPGAPPSGALRASKFAPGGFVAGCLRPTASTARG
jgi:hypothetical protein